MQDTQLQKILILSANPLGTSRLRIDEEKREIREGLRRSKQRDQYSIDTAEAVRYRDIHRAILDYEPRIIHFCGHGAGEEGLVFEDETGQVKLVDAQALAGLFELFADQVECVVLNACYSKLQAEEIARHINYVVGMSKKIGDSAAIEFAVGFYDALGAGRSFEFAYKLGRNVIRNAGITEHLTPVLYLNSKTISSSPVPKELVEIQCKIDCKVQKYAGLVSVENTLQMLPQDVRRYISVQSPNLQAWVENKLERIIKPILLDKKYVDILLDFQAESQKIKREMQAEAEYIGYQVQHIVSLPKLEHDSIKEKLEIKAEKQVFSTNDARLKIALSTAINVKFEKFDKIENYLNQTIYELKDLMKETINSTTTEILRTIDPERFYMRFYEPQKDEKGNLVEISVEKELKNKIQQALEERFGAKVLSVVPIPEQTDIINYLQRLMGIVCSFKCEVPSLTGGEPVKFQGDFNILGIQKESWYIFQSAFQSMRESQQELLQELEALKKAYSKEISAGDIEGSRDKLEEINLRIRTIENKIFGIDDVRRSIEKSVIAKLTIVDNQLFRYIDMKLFSTMKRYINQWARESVLEQYGLEVNIRNLYITRG